ncbi:hypothetical protein [Candidatus Poriferisocius sp.]|uniref:hypothetical protein n=1 Tax=Candidatus Poriferisocius sp. TaxID=3101276 RepID=UPI003B52247E
MAGDSNRGVGSTSARILRGSTCWVTGVTEATGGVATGATAGAVGAVGTVCPAWGVGEGGPPGCSGWNGLPAACCCMVSSQSP